MEDKLFLSHAIIAINPSAVFSYSDEDLGTIIWQDLE